MKPNKPIRRWGEKLRKEIEDAGGVDAWERKKTPKKAPVSKKAPAPPPTPAAGDDHPLAGSLLTERGVWGVSVLKDDTAKGMRVFKLSLSPPKTQKASPIAFVVRVPLEVIHDQRSGTWAADLRDALTSWINADALTSRERTWGKER
jgi:hypothetical protein